MRRIAPGLLDHIVQYERITGVQHDLPISAEPTYPVAHDLRYRACGPDSQADATRNAELAARRRITP